MKKNVFWWHNAYDRIWTVDVDGIPVLDGGTGKPLAIADQDTETAININKALTGWDKLKECGT